MQQRDLQARVERLERALAEAIEQFHKIGNAYRAGEIAMMDSHFHEAANAIERCLKQ